MTDLDKLEQLAKAATPGPWQFTPDNDVSPPRVGSLTTDEWFATVARHNAGRQYRDGWIESWVPKQNADDTAAYIAALSPDVVLKLLQYARIASAMAAMIENESRKRTQASRGGQHVLNTGDLCSAPPSTMSRLEWWAREIRAVGALTKDEP